MSSLFPKALLERIQSVVSIDETAFLAAQNEERRYAVRLNTQKTNRQLLSHHLPLGKEIPWSEGKGYWLEHKEVHFQLDPLWHSGAYYVQEASSMFVAHVLSRLPLEENAPRFYLDACASPGGKTTILYDHLRSQDVLIANEAIASRKNALVENGVRWGMLHTLCTQLYPEQMSTLWQQTFDVVLADVPCSGSGLFRKKKSHQTAWTAHLVAQSAKRQEQILSHLFSTVKEGGYLIYATCSYSPEENEEMIDQLLATKCWQSVRIPFSKAWGIVATYSPYHHGEGYRFFPHLAGGEGFYLAVLQKITSEPSPPTKRFPSPAKDTPRNKRTPSVGLSPLSLSMLQSVEVVLGKGWMQEDYHVDIQPEGSIRYTHSTLHSFLEEHCKRVHVHYLGGHFGKIKGSIFTPSHSLALSCGTYFPSLQCPVTHAQAIDFISGKSIALSEEQTSSNLPKWRIVCFEGTPLGWAKITSSGEIKNYYPSSWAI